MLEIAGALLVLGFGFVMGRRQKPKKKRVGMDWQCGLGRHDWQPDEESQERLVSIAGTGPAFVRELVCCRCGLRRRQVTAVPPEEELERAESIREKLRAAEAGNGRAALKAGAS